MKRRNQFWIELSLATFMLISITAVAEVTVNQESLTGINRTQGGYAVGDNMLNSGKIFFDLTQNDLEIVLSATGSVAYMWGPSLMKIEVWQ